MHKSLDEVEFQPALTDDYMRLAALERLKNQSFYFISVAIDPIVF